jgi:hypothetical protein
VSDTSEIWRPPPPQPDDGSDAGFAYRWDMYYGPGTSYDNVVPCTALNARGDPCGNPGKTGFEHCRTHMTAAELAEVGLTPRQRKRQATAWTAGACAGTTLAGKPCRNVAVVGFDRCRPHLTSDERALYEVSEDQLDRQRRRRETRWERPGVMFFAGRLGEITIDGGMWPPLAPDDDTCESCAAPFASQDPIRQVRWTDDQGGQWRTWVHDACAVATGPFRARIDRGA